MSGNNDSQALSLGYNKGKPVGEIIRFPPNLTLSSDHYGDGASHILGFTVHEYQMGGYTLEYDRAKFSDVFVDEGKPKYYIYLAIPSNQSTTYTHKWSEKEGSLEAAGAINAGSELSKGNISEFIKDALGAGGGILLNGVKKKLGDTMNAALGATGHTVQPYVEVLYEGTGLRAFAFHFKLIPRNPYEVQVIYDIIQVFKWASHPSTPFSDAFKGTRILGYPNVFHIKYLINEDPGTALDPKSDKGKDNPWLHKFGPCVCTQVNVAYSQGAKNYVSYRSNKDYRFGSGGNDGDNVEGAPIYYDLSLNFQEIVFLTKSAINEGF